MALFELLDSLNLISRKILTQKQFLAFHNHVSLQFKIVKSFLCTTLVILTISHEVMQKFVSFSLKITKNWEIVIDRFNGSCEWLKVKSSSCKILVNIDRDPSLIAIQFLISI